LKKFKQERKLIKLATKAEKCISREKAQKILKKADKVQSKLATLTFQEYGDSNLVSKQE
tara:strand:- start:395 stop:571 length:177 start_codon:yes stop_codon:yes gene_type:complete